MRWILLNSEDSWEAEAFFTRTSYLSSHKRNCRGTGTRRRCRHGTAPTKEARKKAKAVRCPSHSWVEPAGKDRHPSHRNGQGRHCGWVYGILRHPQLRPWEQAGRVLVGMFPTSRGRDHITLESPTDHITLGSRECTKHGENKGYSQSSSVAYWELISICPSNMTFFNEERVMNYHDDRLRRFFMFTSSYFFPQNYI